MSRLGETVGQFTGEMRVLLRLRVHNLVFPLIFLLPEFFKHLGFWIIRCERKKSDEALAPVPE